MNAQPKSAIDRRDVASGGRPWRPAGRKDGWVDAAIRQIDDAMVTIEFFRHPAARKYRLFLRSDGVARVTVPPRGNLDEAKRFLDRNLDWLGNRIRTEADKSRQRAMFGHGSLVWYRGAEVPLQINSAAGEGGVGDFVFPLGAASVSDANELRRQVEQALCRLGRQELLPLAAQLAAQHGFQVKRFTVRGQRTRWGSCSRAGTISLNWRLVQAPLFVRDYIILHELAHLRHLNHSKRFWKEVERLCPDFETAEAWLKKNSRKVI